MWNTWYMGMGWGASTLSITTFNITTFSICTRWLPFMLSNTIKFIILSVVMPNFAMLNVIMLDDVFMTGIASNGCHDAHHSDIRHKHTKHKDTQQCRGPLTKFCGKVWKILWTQPFGLGQISYHFISLMNKIFCSAWILQLPTLHNGLNYNTLQSTHIAFSFMMNFVILLLSVIILNVVAPSRPWRRPETIYQDSLHRVQIWIPTCWGSLYWVLKNWVSSVLRPVLQKFTDS